MYENKGIEILIVEDSPTQAAQLKFILENHNFIINVAQNGSEALGLLKKYKPTLIISDIIMPEMDGYELCQKIKRTQEFKDILVILLTTLSDTEDIIKGLECGADNFVTKPFDEGFLLSQIQYMIANNEVHKDTMADLSLNIKFKGNRYSINSNRLQILNLLLSTYETAVDKNINLLKIENELKELNRTLEEKVSEKTAALKKEIDERKQMEQMVIQSEKMASLGTLAAGVAHEINNPIGYISSNLKTMKKYHGKLMDYTTKLQKIIESNAELCEEVRNLSEENKIDFILNDLKAALEESMEGTEKIKKIVSDLRDFSRMEKAQMNYANINDGIEKTLNVIWNELKYKAEVIKEFGDIPEIECNIYQLNQVFMNILINAVHAIEGQGVIKIKTLSRDNCVVVQINDTGSGIPKENINKIFDAFFTTKEPGKGTGLGLSISYKIIQEHNGIIDVESEVGKGTTFTIKLPVQHSQKLKEIKVLIVDDDKSICHLLKEMIIQHNPLMTIKIAVSGFEAADLLNTFKPEIVLLDINMPDIDGFEVLRRIKYDEHMRNTRVVMITGETGEDLQEKSLELGAYKFLRKPIKSQVLYEILDKIILED